MAPNDDVLVHFVEPAPDGSLKSGEQWDPAAVHGTVGPPGGTAFAPVCDPNIKIDGKHHRATGEPYAANCDDCIKVLTERGVSLEVPGRGPPKSLIKSKAAPPVDPEEALYQKFKARMLAEAAAVQAAPAAIIESAPEDANQASVEAALPPPTGPATGG